MIEQRSYKSGLDPEHSEFLKEKASQIVTEPLSENLANIVREGRRWMKLKYKFTSRWQMQQFVQLYYEEFFHLRSGLNALSSFAGRRSK